LETFLWPFGTPFYYHQKIASPVTYFFPGDLGNEIAVLRGIPQGKYLQFSAPKIISLVSAENKHVKNKWNPKLRLSFCNGVLYKQFRPKKMPFLSRRWSRGFLEGSRKQTVNEGHASTHFQTSSLPFEKGFSKYSLRI